MNPLLLAMLAGGGRTAGSLIGKLLMTQMFGTIGLFLPNMFRQNSGYRRRRYYSRPRTIVYRNSYRRRY